MDTTVIKKFWSSSWTVRIGMIFSGLALLDPVGLMAQFPEIWALIPEQFESTVYRFLLGLSGIAMVWKRFQTNTGVTTKKEEVTPEATAKLATGTLTAADITAMREVVSAADKVGK